MAGDIDLGKKFEKLPDVLMMYEDKFEEYKQEADLDGKTLDEITIMNIGWYGVLGENLAELRKILAYMEARVDQRRGELYMGIKNNSQRALGQTEIKQFVEADELYIEVHVLMLEVKEIHDKFHLALETCKSVNYSIGNLIKARIANLQEMTI